MSPSGPFLLVQNRTSLVRFAASTPAHDLPLPHPLQERSATRRTRTPYALEYVGRRGL